MDHMSTSGAVIRLIAGQAVEGRPVAGTLGRHLRALILDSSLQAGERLPSSRTLARELGCARGTVEAAYGDLDAEGLIERRRGSGSFVAPSLGRLEGPTRSKGQRDGQCEQTLSRRGAALAHMARCPFPTTTKAFAGSTPDPREFPWALWRRLWSESLRDGVDDLAGYGDPRGLLFLRRALARWLRVTRGIDCAAEQIIVLHSAQQALTLSATMLFDRGERMVIEDPGYPGAAAAFKAAGLALAPQPVDEGGVITARLPGEPGLRGLYVTPSHQNPLGVTLSLRRRLELIAWASETGAWIIEDDYGGGLSYDHKPIAALTGLDVGGRTIYVGSASKLVFPGLRLAWMVVPEHLVEAFATLRANSDGHSPALVQACLARFIDDGHLARHLRRMTALYRARRDALLDRIDEINRAHGATLLRPGATNAGLKLAVELSGDADDMAVAAKAREVGLELPALSPNTMDLENRRQGFLLGFATLNQAEIDRAAGILGRVLETV
ncbi:MAG: PLP-dependent aminotransferase family protein [Pseudomonadota bacterium]